jgi:caa(3)-type oxidase subunit IV
MADSPEAIKKATRTYLKVGAVLFGGTILTVAVATVPALDVGHHGFDVYDLLLGLAIASVKASLVALVFMHLNHEKRMIYMLFGLGLVGAIALFFLTWLAFEDPIFFDGFYRVFGGG